jgi:hypothetical protein
MEEEFELQKVFQRDINCLVDEDRNLRRRGLDNLNKGLFKSENSEQDVLQLFRRALLRNLLKVLSDKVEKNRELSIQILSKFFEHVKNIDNDLVNSILREIASRLRETPFPEQSEEIRLALVNLLMLIFRKGYHQPFIQNLSEIMHTISKVLTDSYADIKREASQFVIDLSHGIKESVGSHSMPVIKSLAKNLSHQHSKVRKATIESLGEILLTRDAGDFLKEVMPSIKQSTNDKMSDVRKSTYQIIARLLNQFSPSLLRDYETELVQLLLNGLSDDNEDVIKTCQGLIEEAGKNVRQLETEGGRIQEEQPVA